MTVLFFAWSCSKNTVDTNLTTDLLVQEKIKEMEEAITETEQIIQDIELRNGNAVYVPAGSVDALAAAIAEAGANGKIILKSGVHHESSTVLVDQSVKIKGESGAVLMVDTDDTQAGPPFAVSPALHIKGARNVHIEGVEIRPIGDAGHTAVLLEDARNARISSNAIYDFQIGVLLADADHALVYNNRIQGFDPTFANLTWGIAAMDGNGAIIRHNDISSVAIGIFASDTNGKALENEVYSNFIGLLICRVPPVVILPSGEVTGAPISANHWLIGANSAHENLWGILVIDGAFQNSVIQNEAIDNFQYQIELAGPSSRFGNPLPTSSDNLAISVGPFANTPIKDCGVNNTVIGGVPIDTDTDTCF